MIRLLLLLGGGYLVWKAVGEGAAGATGSVSGKGIRLLVVGDSLSLGLSKRLKALAKSAGMTFDNVGKVGSSSSQWGSTSHELGKSLIDKLASFRPTHVIVSLGTNDEAIGNFATQLTGAKAVMARLKAIGAEVFWIGPPTHSKMVQSYRDSLRPLVTNWIESTGLTIPRGGDKLHPTGPGYTMWADYIWKTISLLMARVA